MRRKVGLTRVENQISGGEFGSPTRGGDAPASADTTVTTSPRRTNNAARSAKPNHS